MNGLVVVLVKIGFGEESWLVLMSFSPLPHLPQFPVFQVVVGDFISLPPLSLSFEVCVFFVGAF